MQGTHRLRLSAVAEGDLRTIYDCGFDRWGEAHADAYYDALLSHFEKLCDNPFLYVAVDEIRPGYRRSVCGAHSIYYRISDTHVEIMAILGRQDADDRL